MSHLEVSCRTFPAIMTDLIQWNHSQELQIAILYGYSIEDSSEITIDWYERHNRPDPVAQFSAYSIFDDHAVQSAHEERRRLCILQSDLSEKYCEKCATHDFEACWMARSDTERCITILRAFKNTFIAHTLLAKFRFLCPELTLARMNRDSGVGLLQLLRGLLLEDVGNVPDKFRTFGTTLWEHAGDNRPVDVAIPDKGREFSETVLTVKRQTLLALFGLSVMLDFYGDKAVRVKAGFLYHREERKTSRKKARPCSSHLGPTMTVSIPKQSKLEKFCNTCRKTVAPGERPLFTCANCKEVGRYIFYCGRECQVKDWKEGNPPHKAICGDKQAYIDCLLDGSSEGNASLTSKTWQHVWPPKPGYIRSPALLHQIRLLSEDLDVTYFVIIPETDESMGLHFGGDIVTLTIKRNYVMSCHSPWLVRQLFDIISLNLTRLGYGHMIDGLKEQLRREYDVKVDEVEAVDGPGMEAFRADISRMAVLNLVQW